MAPEEKATWMLSIYNGQYASYMTTTGHTKSADGDWLKTSDPELDEAQKEVLREKKKILTEVYPMIGTYAGYADSGVIPDADLETLIVQNLERLLGMI